MRTRSMHRPARRCDADPRHDRFTNHAVSRHAHRSIRARDEHLEMAAAPLATRSCPRLPQRHTPFPSRSSRAERGLSFLRARTRNHAASTRVIGTLLELERAGLASSPFSQRARASPDPLCSVRLIDSPVHRPVLLGLALLQAGALAPWSPPVGTVCLCPLWSAVPASVAHPAARGSLS